MSASHGQTANRIERRAGSNRNQPGPGRCWRTGRFGQRASLSSVRHRL